MPELQRLSADHAQAVLEFERANRAWFARTITDRGDAFFEEFESRYAALLAEQDAGVCAFHVLVEDDGTIVGRANLYDLADGVAAVGYRVAEHVAGRGLATSALEELCALASQRYGLHTLRAATSEANLASQAVLTKAGFVPVRPADPSELGGRAGTWWERDLSPRNGA